MIAPAQKRATFLFYLYSFLDESYAVKAANRTLGLARKSIKNTDQDASKNHKIVDNTFLVQLTYRHWKKLLNKKPVGRGVFDPNCGIITKRGLDLGLWRQFLKEAESEEFLCVLWSKVLKMSDLEIAKGLNVSTGTVRHRVSRGLRLLGSLRIMHNYD